MNFVAFGQAVNTALMTVANMFNVVKDHGPAYFADSSLPEIVKLTRVEPVTIVSKDLLNNPETKTVLNSMLSIFIGYYLQAMDLMTKVRHVEGVRMLDRLNPDRDETGFLLSNGRTHGSVYSRESFSLISTEDYTHCLPTHSRLSLEQQNQSNPVDLQHELEQKAKKLESERNKIELEKVRIENEKLRVNTDKAKLELDNKRVKLDEQATKVQNQIEELEKQRKSVTEIGQSQEFDLDTMVNLSIGRLMNVSVGYNSKEHGTGKGDNYSFTIPIAFRLMVSTIPNEAIQNILTYHDQDMSFMERFHSARSGRIQFIRDLIFCQDLIDEYRKAALRDQTNVLSEITQRAINAKKYGMLTKNPSLVSASTLVVISDTVAKEIEKKLGGKLTSASIRDKAFKNTYTMVMAIVSESWQNVTFYTRGIAMGSTYSFRELEGKTRGNGPDVSDIMKALTAGQPPSF